MTLFRQVAVTAIFAAACWIGSGAAETAQPGFADFQGHWVVSRVLGSSPGGVTAEAPRTLIGRPVEWTPGAVRTVGKTCILHDAAIRKEPNRKLEDSIWGGQTIAGLALSQAEAGAAFGSRETSVFEDRDGCAYAVSINHDQLILTFPSGYIYLLQRSIPHT